MIYFKRATHRATIIATAISIFKSYLKIQHLSLSSGKKGLATIIATAVLFPETDGAAMVISDDRVRSLDIAPVLGRGYSIGTNNF